MAVVLGLVATGCGKRRQGSPTDGGLAGGEYTNRYFGFAFPVPKGWTVAPQEAVKETTRSGREMLAESADKRLKAALEEAEKKTHTLLLISEHPLEATVAFNANIIVAAESVRRVRRMKTGADYLNQMRTVMKLANTGSTSRGAPKEMQLGGRTFYREQYVTGTVEQAYYVSILDGYAVAFIVSAENKDDLSRVEVALKDLRFQ